MLVPASGSATRRAALPGIAGTNGIRAKNFKIMRRET